MSTPARTPAIRIRNGNHASINEKEICYWYDLGTQCWWIYLPKCGAGVLLKHEVTENQDGTITVLPSIKMTGHDHGQTTIRHGYLKAGQWEPCSDDHQVIPRE